MSVLLFVLIPLNVYCHFPFDVHSKYLQNGLCLISDSLFDILSSLKSDQIGTFSIVTRIWPTFRHLEKTIEPLVRLCSISRGIRMAMPTRLKSKLKSHLMLWMYITLASNLGGEFTDGDLVVARLPWWLARWWQIFLVARRDNFLALIISAELFKKFPRAKKRTSCDTNDNGLPWLLPFLHFLRHRRNYSVTASCPKNILPRYFAVENKPTKETIASDQNFFAVSVLWRSDNIWTKRKVSYFKGFLVGITAWSPCSAAVYLDFAS